jgi:hypothetical protein
MLVCVFVSHFAHETAGAASTRSSLRPLNLKRDKRNCKPRAKYVARMRSCIHRHCEPSGAHSRDPLARNDVEMPLRIEHPHASVTIGIARTQPPLSSQVEQFRATRRRTAVEIATCPRQCAVALRSNFCRHTYRMVNLQAVVLTSAQTSLADGSRGRVRVRFQHFTSPCR